MSQSDNSERKDAGSRLERYFEMMEDNKIVLPHYLLLSNGTLSDFGLGLNSQGGSRGH